MPRFKIDDILPIVGILGELFAKSSKGRWLFGTLTDILSYHDTIDEVRAKFAEAVTQGSGLTLGPDDVIQLNALFTNLDHLLDRVKEKM